MRVWHHAVLLLRLLAHTDLGVVRMGCTTETLRHSNLRNRMQARKPLMCLWTGFKAASAISLLSAEACAVKCYKV